MTTGEPFKLILWFSIPLLLGNIFQQFYSMVDTIIVGKILGTQVLAAVGTTGPLNFLVLGFASGITSGFAVFASLVLIFFGESLTKLFIDGNQPEVIDTAMIYLRICAMFFPFLNMIFVYRNMLQGVGKSFMPLMAGVFELIARAIVSFTLPAVIGFTGICLAGPIAWMAAAIPLGITYFIEIRKMMRDWKLRQA